MNPSVHLDMMIKNQGYQILINTELRGALPHSAVLEIAKNTIPKLSDEELINVLDALAHKEIKIIRLINFMRSGQVYSVLATQFDGDEVKTKLCSIKESAVKVEKVVHAIEKNVLAGRENFGTRIEETKRIMTKMIHTLDEIEKQFRFFSSLNDDQVDLIQSEFKHKLISKIWGEIKTLRPLKNEIKIMLQGSSENGLRHRLDQLSRFATRKESDLDERAIDSLPLTQTDYAKIAEALECPKEKNPIEFVFEMLDERGVSTKRDLVERGLFGGSENVDQLTTFLKQTAPRKAE